MTLVRADGFCVIPQKCEGVEAGEAYDFAIPQSYLELPIVKAFIGILKSGEFRRKLNEMGGCGCRRLGEIVLIPSVDGDEASSV